MKAYSYTRWDGRQDYPDIDKDSLLTELERTLTSAGDLSSAVWKMQREGIENAGGERLPGNRELYQRLEDRRRELLQNRDFTSLAKALRHQLDKITEAENFKDLPEDVQSQLDTLKRHPFENPAARREFERLLEALRANSLEALGGSGNKPAGAGSGRSGEISPSLQKALELLSLLQKMDRLEVQLRSNQRRRSLDAVNPRLVAEVLGEDCAGSIERLQHLNDILEDAGYVREVDEGFELTPRAIRKIGQRALEEIYAQMRRDAAGSHSGDGTGGGGMRLEETKRFEFGDDFNIHLLNTVINSLLRAPRKPPIALAPDDFETIKTEPMERAAAVLALDLSRSMPKHGNFQSAKRVALALSELIRSRFPTDTLYVVGFSTYARQVEPAILPLIGWDDRDRYTNIQHALWLARRLLSRAAGANKHIILVTDGEPTAHIENGRILAKYPPTPITRQVTLNEVRACTEEGIAISAFIFEGAEFTKEFINGLARINRGRIFFTSAGTLGKYLLIDYVRQRSRAMG